MKNFYLGITLLYVAMSAPVGQAQNLVRKFGYIGTWQLRDRAGNVVLTFKFKDNALCNLKDDLWAHGLGQQCFLCDAYGAGPHEACPAFDGNG